MPGRLLALLARPSKEPRSDPGAGAMPLAPCLQRTAPVISGMAGRAGGSVSQIPVWQQTRRGPQSIVPITRWAIPWRGWKSPPAPSSSPTYLSRSGRAWAAWSRPATSRAHPSVIKEEKYFNAFMKIARKPVNDAPAS